MDLRFNPAAAFTRWLAETGALKEPFVLIDVGVHGGEQIRWQILGESLIVHGFDAIEEEISRLREQKAEHPNRHYHWMALGSEEGERDFHVNTLNPTSSSMYSQMAGDRSHRFGGRVEATRRVPVRRLDTLLREGAIPAPDFLKVD